MTPMKTLLPCLLASLLSAPVLAVEDQTIDDAALGLSKTSVFDDPAPAVIDWSSPDAGTYGKRAKRSYNAAPPMITHTVKDMLPITRESNTCRDCHVQPGLIGVKLEMGIPVPAPVTHYQNLKEGELYMGRWNCVQCHRPQAEVKLLVESTFDKKARAKK